MERCVSGFIVEGLYTGSNLEDGYSKMLFNLRQSVETVKDSRVWQTFNIFKT
jgi:hypothetical protein